MKRPELAPKALIHQKFGSQASYRIEEVRQPIENSCPGLALAQQTRSLYICYLDLPELSVMSDPLPKKKDAEHAAAKIAIEKVKFYYIALHFLPLTSHLVLIVHFVVWLTRNKSMLPSIQF